MRLWHQELIPLLDRQRLLGQHRECTALRGKGWGKKHSVVNYVFNYAPNRLVAYHYLIMDEMEKRGYHPDKIWRNPNWRGSNLGEQADWAHIELIQEILLAANNIYPEHNEQYLQECIKILKEKGIEINV